MRVWSKTLYLSAWLLLVLLPEVFMRWLFLLLVVLNIFYYIWHQREAPLRAKEVISLPLHKGVQQGISLLSEARPGSLAGEVQDGEAGAECFYLGGFSSESMMRNVQRRLAGMDIHAEPVETGWGGSTVYALSVAQDGRGREADMVFQELANEFNELKYKKMRCQGLQLPNSLHRMAPAPQ